MPEWSSEQFFCRAEARDPIWESFINNDPEWVLKEIVHVNLHTS